MSEYPPNCTREDLLEVLEAAGFKVVHQDSNRIVARREGSSSYEGRVQIRAKRDDVLSTQFVRDLLIEKGGEPDRVDEAISGLIPKD